MLVTLGTVDVTYMLYEWALANKATYVGARAAVVSNPVAQNITQDRLLYDPSQLYLISMYAKHIRL
jgi:Flp pilus assembly protein TadG